MDGLGSLPARIGTISCLPLGASAPSWPRQVVALTAETAPQIVPASKESQDVGDSSGSIDVQLVTPIARRGATRQAGAPA